MASRPVSISIIIVTHNSCATIADCLRAIPPACGELSFELVVVDNKSQDNILELTRAAFPNAIIVEQTKNIGFGAACNIGANTAGGENLLLLNPDAVLDPGSVTRLVEACDGSDNPGFVVPRLRHPDGRFQPSCRRLPTIGNMIFSRGSMLARVFAREDENNSERYTLPDYQQTTEVEAVAGTVALIKRSLFLSAGGFDRRYFLYMEDTDLCLSLGRRGARHLFVPSAGAVHGWGRGSATGKLKRVWHHHLSVWKYFLKHYPNGFSVVLLPCFLIINGLATMILPDRRMKAQP